MQAQWKRDAIGESEKGLQKMNILIIPAFFQTKKSPTLGSFFWDQALALRRAGHKVTLFYSDTYSVKYIKDYITYEEESIFEKEGIIIYRRRYFCPLKHGMEGYREAFAKGILQLYNKYYIQIGQLDVIHAHCCVWAGYAAMRLSEKIGVPYIITEHATLFELHKDQISKSNNRYIRQVFEQAAKVICVSHAFAELISEYRSANDIAVIGNVVDFEQFKPCACESHKKVRFLTVCYMNTYDQLKKKGIDILLKAWKDFARKCDTAKLFIGGGGQAAQKAIEWCKEYDILDSVSFLGSLDRSQVVSWMQQCDCFVLPSRYETFGVVYVEAMACGKPVIAAANGGPDDFVKDFNGMLIAPDDSVSLQYALEQMYNACKRYDPNRIRMFVQNQFSEQAISQQLEQTYQQIIGKG